MRKLFTILIIISASAAHAEFTKLNDVSKLPTAPGADAYARGRAASLAIEVGDEACSAIAISPDGYVLTALHCLENCNSVVDKERAGAGYLLSADADNIQSGDAKCSMSIIGDRKSHSGKGVIVAAGVGYFAGVVPQPESDSDSAGDPPQVKAFKTQGLSQKIDVSQDYAIIKFEKPVADGCVKVNPALVVGAPMWAIGFPTATEGRRHDSPGQTLVYTDGTATRVGASVISTLDIVPGNSGGGQLNADGELVALSRGLDSSIVGSAAVASILKHPAPNSASAITMAHILSDLTARYGSDVVKQAFNCY